MYGAIIGDICGSIAEAYHRGIPDELMKFANKILPMEQTDSFSFHFFW